MRLTRFLLTPVIAMAFVAGSAPAKTTVVHPGAPKARKNKIKGRKAPKPKRRANRAN